MKIRIRKQFIIIALLAIVLCQVGCNGKKQQEQTNSTIQAETTEATETKTTESTETESTKITQTTQEFEIVLSNNNSWEQDGKKCAQLDGFIKNHTDVAAKDWKVTVTVPSGSKIQNSWNGNYNLNGTTLVITPVDYNKEVAAKGEVPFGFIIETPSDYNPTQVVLDLAGKQYRPGDKNDVATKEETSTQEKTEQGTNEETSNEEATTEIAAAQNEAGNAVAKHGALSVKGTNIVDKNGQVFQLQGVSTHGINWFPEYVNKDAFSDLSKYGVNAIRLAMYTADYNGYCSGGNQGELENIIDNGVKACTELGMYVIVDWHILNDNDPNQNKDSAKTFFDKMSKKYAGQDNVIYEICNEPNGGTTWESVKAYAEEIIPVIRKNDKDALIIVGTPTWSQDVDIASKNPIKNQENILYAVHFYAATHQENIRNKVETAISNGIPVIVSESNISEASGNGSLNYDEGNKWMDLIDKYHLSCFAWSLGNKDETSSFLKSSVTKTSGFSKDDFSDAGKWYLEQYSK
ncbi:MAG: endoglucanase [Lachnospiraceae bacterium]|nr:endoglucanase [Lachnospiraceae bacterium]